MTPDFSNNNYKPNSKTRPPDESILHIFTPEKKNMSVNHCHDNNQQLHNDSFLMQKKSIHYHTKVNRLCSICDFYFKDQFTSIYSSCPCGLLVCDSCISMIQSFWLKGIQEHKSCPATFTSMEKCGKFRHESIVLNNNSTIISTIESNNQTMIDINSSMKLVDFFFDDRPSHSSSQNSASNTFLGIMNDPTTNPPLPPNSGPTQFPPVKNETSSSSSSAFSLHSFPNSSLPLLTASSSSQSYQIFYKEEIESEVITPLTAAYLKNRK
jgi:hypothetical protein